MILLCGIPSERPLALVRERLLQLSAPFVDLNQRDIADISLAFEIAGGAVCGELRLGFRSYRLQDITAVYNRMMNPEFLPEIEPEPADSPKRRHALLVNDAIVRWAEVAPARVVNRVYPSSSNSAKAYQNQLIRRHGFLIPDTLLTNDPAAVRRFIAEKRDVIFKSVSGARSIVTRFAPDHEDALARVAHCPTMFQELIAGTDIRVHVVGKEVFATRVEAETTDYR